MAAKVTKFVNATPGPGYWYSQNVHVGFFSNNTRIQNGHLLIQWDNDTDSTGTLAGSSPNVNLLGTFDKTTPWANVYTGNDDTMRDPTYYYWPGTSIGSSIILATSVGWLPPGVNNPRADRQMIVAELPSLPPIIKVDLWQAVLIPLV